MADGAQSEEEESQSVKSGSAQSAISVLPSSIKIRFLHNAIFIWIGTITGDFLK
jgi:hypothetical protein